MNTEDDDGDYTVSAEIRCGDPLLIDDLKLFGKLTPTAAKCFWPTVEWHVTGLEFFAALLTQSMNEIVGSFDNFVFVYTDR